MRVRFRRHTRGTPHKRAPNQAFRGLSEGYSTLPPPLCVTPDLGNPQDGGRTLLLAWVIVCGDLAILFFLTRTSVKLWVVRKILAEDSAPN